MKDQIQTELQKLMPQLQRITKMIKEAEDFWTAHYDRKDPEAQYLRHEFNAIGERLDDVRIAFGQATAPVVDRGFLKKNENGRYSTFTTELSSGMVIEYLKRGQHGDPDRWVESRVEHNGTDYCLDRDKNLPLRGLNVRIKRINRWG